MIDDGRHSDHFVGTTAALILGGLAAGGALGGAAIQSHAAGSAADKQQQATDQALGLQTQVYNNTRAALSPYADLGASAIGNLRQLAGIAPPNNGMVAPPQVPTNARQSLATLAPNAYSYNPGNGRTTFNGYNPQTGQITGAPPVVLDPRTGQMVPNPVAAQGQSGYVLPNGMRATLPNGQTSYYPTAGGALLPIPPRGE